MSQWSYEGETGPANWAKFYPPAGGNTQSPINIETEKAEYDQQLSEKPLSFTYDDNCFKFVENTGASFNVTGTPEAVSHVTGGPVKDDFKFLQFHIHWGTQHEEGSEHTVNGKMTEAELHIVNWNSSLYKTPGEAASSSQNNGLIVLGVMLKVGKANPELNKIIPSLHDVPLKGQKTSLKETLAINNLFPENPGYYTYKGSLTTPPCFESVRWVVFKDQVEVSEEQLKAFRELNNCSDVAECCEGSKIKHNYRPVCALNDRKVCKSFQ